MSKNVALATHRVVTRLEILPQKDCFEYFTQAKRLIKRWLNHPRGNFLAEFDFSNPSRQDEADFAVPGFFIQPHGIEKFSALARV